MSEPPSVERLWQLTVEHSPVGMTVVRPDGTLSSANRALCSMLRYRESELRGMSFTLLTHPDDLPGHTALFEETLAGERSSYRITKRCLRSDGTTLWGDLSVALLRDDDGAPLHLIGQIHDVTASREDQERLSEAVDLIDRQRRRSRALFDSVDVGLLLLDREGRYEEWNRRHRDFLALAYPEGHQGQAGQLGEVFAADGRTVLGAHDMPTTRAVRGEEFDDYRIWVGADPAVRTALSISARSVVGPSGELAGAALAYSDITELMRALLAREEFLASVSHELRTPLTSVLGHLELLLEDVDDPDLARRLQVVHRNAVRLRHLVSDLLESAGQRDGVQLARARCDVADLVRDAVASAAGTAARQGLELVADLPASARATVDPDRLRQVVDNLVSNAVKYTDPGGAVTISLATADDDGLRLVVTDTGIGIPPDELDQVFEPFYRSGEAARRVTPGVGLGLGIARAIVIAHGGTLEVTSEPGRGSEFVVSLP